MPDRNTQSKKLAWPGQFDVAVAYNRYAPPSTLAIQKMSEEKTEDSAMGRLTPKAKEAKEMVVPQDKANRRTDRRRPITGLSRLLVAISITIIFLVLLLQPPIVDLDTILDQSEDRKTALISTAHPDDEVMFFTPTILALLAAGWEVGALCLSNGASLRGHKEQTDM